MILEALYRMTVKPLLKQALCGGITYQSPRNLLPMFIQRSSLLGGRGHPLGFSFGEFQCISPRSILGSPVTTPNSAMFWHEGNEQNHTICLQLMKHFVVVNECWLCWADMLRWVQLCRYRTIANVRTLIFLTSLHQKRMISLACVSSTHNESQGQT